jgi:hypothetical protein
MISSLMVFLKILPDVFSFLRRSYSFKPWFPILSMPSSFAQHLFLNGRPFWVLGADLSLSCP